MLRNIKIVYRLGLGFGLLILVFVFMAVFELERMNTLSKQTSLMYDHPLTVSNAVLRINTNIIKIHRNMKDVALAPDIDSINKASLLVDNIERDIYKDFDIVNKRFLGKKETLQEALNAFIEWKVIRDEVISLMRAGKNTEAASITKGKGAIHVSHIERDMAALSEFAQNKAGEFYNRANSIIGKSFKITYLFIAASLAFVTLFAVFFTRSITIPIRKSTRTAELISEGNLTHRMETSSNDEIGQLANSFNTMVDSLKQAQDELVKKEKFATIGRISGSIAHDIRHPLATIKNSAYYLNMTLKDPNEKTKKHLKLIDSEVIRANEIITSLMRLSELKKPVKSRININEFVNVFFSQFPLPEHIKLVTEIDNQCSDILVDPSHLKQIFTNLESNAVKAMPTIGTINVKARSVLSSEPEVCLPTSQEKEIKGYFVKISFSDTGSGIRKDVLDNVFEPFYTTRSKGVGLGLSIVRDIVTSNGGTISVESKEGNGSTFTIVFPGVKD